MNTIAMVLLILASVLSLVALTDSKGRDLAAWACLAIVGYLWL